MKALWSLTDLISWRVLVSGFVSIGLSCTSTSPSRSGRFVSQYRTGQYQSAAENISEVSSRSSSKKNLLLWALQETVVHYWAGDFDSCVLAGKGRSVLLLTWKESPC